MLTTIRGASHVYGVVVTDCEDVPILDKPLAHRMLFCVEAHCIVGATLSQINTPTEMSGEHDMISQCDCLC